MAGCLPDNSQPLFAVKLLAYQASEQSVASTTMGKLQYYHGGTGVFLRWY